MPSRPRRRVLLRVVAALALTLAAPLGDRPVQSHSGGDAVALVRVRITSDADLAALAGFDLAEARHGDHVDVVAWPGDLARLRSAGLRFSTAVEDLRALTESAGYRRLADYERELADLAARFPAHVRLVTGPYPTFEGRRVTGVEIGDDVEADDGRPVAMLLGLHHAREWPSGELTMDFARELAEGHGTDPQITELLRRVRVILVPVVNPDGFHHARQSAVDREVLGVVAGGQGAYWRKNRRATTVGDQGVATYGVDPNRNYGQHWGSGSPALGTTSSNPLDQSYQGRAPFSEPESANVRHWILSRPVVAFVTNHTYSNLVLWPWGWTRAPSPDAAAFERLGAEFAALNRYQAIQSSALYPTTGTTEDWAYATAGVLGFTFEHGTSFHPDHDGFYPPLYAINRAPFRHLLEAAADTARHAVVTGQVVAGGEGRQARLRLRRSGSLQLAPGNPSGLDEITETVDLTMTTDPDGRFSWHVNPSTRPLAPNTESYELTVALPDGRIRTLPVTVSRGGVAALGAVSF